MIGGGLDHHGQLHRRGFHLDRSFGIGIERTVDDVRPMNKIRDGCGIEPEALLRDHRNETGTRLEIGVVKLAIALVLLKVLGIRWRKKCALVVIEPPCDLGRTGVFEVDDGVLVAVELLLVEQRAGSMNQSGEFEFDVAANALAIKAGKQRGRRGSVETLIMVKDANSQSIPQSLQKI